MRETDRDNFPFHAPSPGHVLDRDRLADYPLPLRRALAETARHYGRIFYVAGGAVRDWLQGRFCADIDIAVQTGAYDCARYLAERLRCAFVPLDEQEGVARLVWQDFVVDFSCFRAGTQTIEADLGRRDFTINAMAVLFDPDRQGLARPYQVIDPTGGLDDLRNRVVRATSRQVFHDDPLRLLRAYRFAAALDFSIDTDTGAAIAVNAVLLSRPAPERISGELDRIMQSGRAGATVSAMAGNGILGVVMPELTCGAGMEQPTSHHLDVLGHSLETLAWMERLQEDPDARFPGYGELMAAYLSEGRRRLQLNWAALLHDIGKPPTRLLRDQRITFYNHDREGVLILTGLARRLRWRREDERLVARFIETHMWPFHLNNARLKTGITPRACLRLVRSVGADLPGLFLLAMADSLAGQGPNRPLRMEANLAALFDEVQAVYQKTIRPVLETPRFLTGHDLQQEFGLTPGPLFGTILKGLEEARVAGEVEDRDQALAWIRRLLGRA